MSWHSWQHYPQLVAITFFKRFESMDAGKDDGISAQIDHLIWNTAWLDQIPALC